MAAVSVGGLAVALFYPSLSGGARRDKRVAAMKGRGTGTSRLPGKNADQNRDRRRKVQDTLKQLEEKQKAKKKKVTLRNSIQQAGYKISVKTFWIISIVAGLVTSIVVLLTGSPPLVSVGVGFIATFGIPRWVLGFLKKRRAAKFLNEFANAIDVIVRGVKSGLPVNDSFKVVGRESPDPVGPEFQQVVEGQRLGITLEQGLERMFERMPLAEVNFLTIVITIQKQTGGNLAEALGNLSVVLRDRKKMQGKIKAMSQEAKSSAAIIGALPIAIMTLTYMTNPEYIMLLWTERLGQIMLMGCATWMTIGVLVMKKMINFDF